MKICMDLRDVMRVTYPKFSPSICRNKLVKFNYCRAKKYNSY
jgi:hypothetical protein